jgi:hypothetical protein
MLQKAKQLNRANLPGLFPAQTAAVVQSLDNLHAIAAFHAGTIASLQDAAPHPANRVLFSCFHKTLLSLYAAHESTLDGPYGIARPHLRQAFESLMIAKLCATDPASDVFDKWIDGLDLYFTNGILRRIVRPDTGQFSESWRVLCKWSHATVFANQLSLDLEATVEQTAVNLAFIGALLNFQDHLLNRHILTPTMKYYAERYGDKSKLAEAKTALRISLSTLKSHLGLPAKRLVRDFRATWQLK